MTHDNLLGTVVDGYEITSLIGHGGMATVYKARQISMDRIVAMKILPRQYIDDDTYIQRFDREVSIVSRLEHRAIVPVYDHGEHHRQPYIVMRYMPAGSVDQCIADDTLGLERISKILNQIAPALDYAHSKSVLHRDLKPSNVLLDDEGGAYLTDFGIARILGESASTITTQGVVGTPAYMSPEQAQGLSLDNRSDIYSLGVMLFEMVTGRRPFESETPYGVAVMQVTTPPPPPTRYKPTLPHPVERVLLKAMEKQPDKRYQTTVALATALEQAINAPDESIRDTQPRPVQLQNTLPSPPPQPPVHAPDFTPPPYSAPANQPPSHAGESAWMPPVAAPQAKPRQRNSPAVSIMLGSLIGCGLLTVLIAVTALLIGNLDAIFPPVTLTPTATFQARSSDQDSQQNALPIIIATADNNTPTPNSVRIIPSNTPEPTATPLEVTVVVLSPTPAADNGDSDGILPPGVRTSDPSN